MPKLTDTQLIILAAAAKRDDGAILPLPKKLKLDSHAGATVFRDLLKKRLIAEKAASSEAAAWRDGEDGQRMMLVATKAGRRAIGAAAANERTVTPKAGMKGARGCQRKAPTDPTSRGAPRERRPRPRRIGGRDVPEVVSLTPGLRFVLAPSRPRSSTCCAGPRGPASRSWSRRPAGSSTRFAAPSPEP